MSPDPPDRAVEGRGFKSRRFDWFRKWRKEQCEGVLAMGSSPQSRANFWAAAEGELLRCKLASVARRRRTLRTDVTGTPRVRLMF